VNEARVRTGFDPVPYSALRLKRKIVKPFDQTAQGQSAKEAAWCTYRCSCFSSCCPAWWLCPSRACPSRASGVACAVPGRL